MWACNSANGYVIQQWALFDIEWPTFLADLISYSISVSLGTYQGERSGLYQTSTYDPLKLQGQMNAEEKRGGHLFDITEIHKDSLNLPTQLNHDMADVGSDNVITYKRMWCSFHKELPIHRF